MTKKEITQLSYEIVGCAIKVHKKLGPGLLESIYEECLKYELSKKGFDVKQHWKTLGKQMTKMQLEGRLETVLYAEITGSESKKKYMLRTENKGLDTARAPMGLFPEYIESDYQILITELDKYYNA